MSKDNVTVLNLIEEIKSTRTQTSANAKDEKRVAMAMLNDPTYVVDVYGKDGVIDTYSPYVDTRSMVADVIKSTTKMSSSEAQELANNYEFNANGAQAFINFGKEFINTYVKTGRKIKLGCREESDVALQEKVKEAKVNSFPMPTAVDANGEKTYTTTASMTPQYKTLKVSGSCPTHLKRKANNK